MDIKKIEALANMKFLLGDQGAELEECSEMNLFLDTLFGRKRLLILKVNGSKNKIFKELNNYCKVKNLQAINLHGQNLKVEDVRGEIEITYIDGMPYSDRKKPFYVSGNKQMIIVDNVDKNVDIEVLRAFLYMASLDCYYDDIENLPKDKLPFGSAYVFIAEDNFPLDRFAAISSYWKDEAAILDLRDFQTRIKEHMGEYKRNILKISEDGIYHYQNKDYVYEHILFKDKNDSNIIEKYRTDFFESEYKKSITLHKYFHHLNSSQGMCINFFYPLIKERHIELILDILGIKGNIGYDNEKIKFEKESEIEEGPWRKTNFDFYIQLESSTKIYFEIKYTENEFGKAPNDAGHKDKFNKLYKPMIHNSEAIKEAFKTEEYFLNNYQIMRNIAHISKDSYVVFLYPRENYSIRKQALKTREEVIEEKMLDHFILFTWEDIVEQLILALPSKKLKNYYSKEFTYKYLEY
jgi:hypothetical protein